MRNGKEKEKKKVWLFTNYDKYEECTLYVCYNVVEKRKKEEKKKRNEKREIRTPRLKFLTNKFHVYTIPYKP